MDLSFINELFMPLVLVACLCLGYVIKKSLDFIPNKYIPLILAIVGAFVACIANAGVSLENVVYGAVTGLASTGMHQTFTRLIERKEEEV